ncbi:Uncharacterised protein [uncultured archaeon]|nr:Uncharacterised protein [uncultured archaeon]
MTEEKKESNIIKLFKMVYEALFSPSPHDELYKPSELIPRMAFFYFITIIVVIVVIYLVLKWIGFDWRSALSSLGF